MARKPKASIDDTFDEPIELEEPYLGDEEPVAKPSWNDSNVWLRGFFALLLGIMFTFAAPILGLMALVQFFWILFTGEKNDAIADLGTKLSDWMADAGKFGTGATEDNPFPWTDIK